MIAQQMMSKGAFLPKKTAQVNDDVVMPLFIGKSARYALPVNWYPRRPCLEATCHSVIDLLYAVGLNTNVEQPSLFVCSVM